MTVLNVKKYDWSGLLFHLKKGNILNVFKILYLKNKINKSDINVISLISTKEKVFIGLYDRKEKIEEIAKNLACQVKTGLLGVDPQYAFESGISDVSYKYKIICDSEDIPSYVMVTATVNVNRENLLYYFNYTAE